MWLGKCFRMYSQTSQSHQLNCSGYGRLWYLRICLFLAIIAISLPGLIRAQTSEYTMKAVYLERFSRFIDWPEETAMDDTTKPFVIALIGDTPLYETLKSVFADQKILKKNVVIRFATDTSEIKTPHVLFISESEKNNVSDIVSTVNKKAVLTIGDTEGFAELGVLINLYLADGKVRFEINEESVKESPLSISYHLMRMAKIIKTSGDEQ